jgi:NADPH:quinone reductase-like Zn-dependent oxidoreductase
MRAVVHDRYGPPEVLRIEEVERPVPGDDELLVRVRATTVNRSDCHRRGASPFLWRLLLGLRHPKRRVLGMEFAGVVEAVGSAVDGFAVGDEVFGLKWSGAQAELLCIPAGKLVAHKPDNVTFEQAAAVPDGAVNALVCLRRADVAPGMHVLVYGASGSIGTATVQLAKHMGARSRRSRGSAARGSRSRSRARGRTTSSSSSGCSRTASIARRSTAATRSRTSSTRAATSRRSRRPATSS